MERALKTIILPVSKLNVSIVTFWNWNEQRQISILAVGDKNMGDVKDIKNLEPKDITVARGLEIQSLIMKLAVKKITDETEKEISYDEFLENVPSEDVDFLSGEINNIGLSEKKN